MDRQTTFLLALGLLIVAGLTVGVSGWVLVVRDRASARNGLDTLSAPADEAHHLEGRERA